MLQAIQSKSFSNALSLGSGIASTFWATWFEMIRNLSFGWGCSFPWGPTLLTTTFFLSPGIVMIMMLRILFGAETVSSKLTTACFHVDSWFTGADFPHAALACIRSAVRRRKLVFYLYFVLLNVCVRMWGSMFLLFVLWQVTKSHFFYWAAPLQGMGKNLSSFLVELVMCPEPPAGY